MTEVWYSNLKSFYKKNSKIYKLYSYSPSSSIISYISPPIWKLHPHGDIISKLYKPTFHSGHLSHNMSYGGAATLQVFHLPW